MKGIIDLGNDSPGALGLDEYDPVRMGLLNQLLDSVLIKHTSLKRSELEMFAAYVSKSNRCLFGMRVHTEIARELAKEEGTLEDLELLESGAYSQMSSKLSSLMQLAFASTNPHLSIALDTIIDSCRDKGATDSEIYVVLSIASYVSCINHITRVLNDAAKMDTLDFRKLAKSIIENGYSKKILEKKKEVATPA